MRRQAVWCRLLRPRDSDNEHCRPEGVSIIEAAQMWEESGYLPPLSDCLENYPELKRIVNVKR